ncbi:hypothetical protein HUT18_12935 [Streptomyces sp. NA04227]|uniref:hypothetical protein n=1 Tax=Streptomyces sp. NA04227 TaxID=2742136 RepID=UPI001591F025|nr:hypothetical protein HUT18_12935 [Streptomyces sp. NA04227]
MRSASFRYLLGSVLALVGAAAAVWSPFRAWYDGRHGRDFRLEDLFSSTGVSNTNAELLGSLFLPFAVAAVVTVIALALRSRLLLVLAGLIVLGFTALWMTRQAQEDGSLRVAGDGTGLDHGAAMALGGALLLLLAAAVLPGRKSKRRSDRAVSSAPTAAYETAAAPPPAPTTTAVPPSAAYDRAGYESSRTGYEAGRTGQESAWVAGQQTAQHNMPGAGARGNEEEAPTRAWPSPYTAGRAAAQPAEADQETVAGSSAAASDSPGSPGSPGSPTTVDSSTPTREIAYGADDNGGEGLTRITWGSSSGSSAEAPSRPSKGHRPWRTHATHKRS